MITAKERSLTSLYGSCSTARLMMPFAQMPNPESTKSTFARCLVAVLFLAGIGHTLAAPSLRVEASGPDAQGRIILHAPGKEGAVYSLQASTNLADWNQIATTHTGLLQFPDPATREFASRYYRIVERNITQDDDWKNQVRLPNDPFLSTPGEVVGPEMRWIKFAISLREPHRVYYQDSQKYGFHYDFAHRRLDPFTKMTPAEFDLVALHTNQQQIVLGAVLIPPFPIDSEYGIQFVGTEAYAPEDIRRYFELVRSTVVSDVSLQAFYVPTYEQARSAEDNRNYFSAHGIQVASSDRWVFGDDIYSTGWALGRLKFFSGAEISNAFADGRLTPEDILLTDGVPAEIPVLAGVLSLTPSTPNSHVAILSKSFGLPFAYISDPNERTRIQQLVGKDILLRLDPYVNTLRVVELGPDLPPSLRAEILSLKVPPQLQIVAKQKRGALSASTDQLTPADIKYFGGKASNFGFLRRNIPERSPVALALSFDLWDTFLDQILPSGQTLRSAIDDRLSGHSYPPNVAALKKDLADIRALITKSARFAEGQKAAILSALDGFTNTHNIRFRSSTNVEDSEQFTGAGLYDSYSGCKADDLDGDEMGPSLCDPTEKEERGVFRALQKVYASFYNDNAVIERLRHHVAESDVGMAILAHYSTPDETELANGVATVQVVRGSGDGNSVNGPLVTQKGAVSVTNPDGTATPEVVQGYHSPFGVGGFLSQRSGLVPLGAYVMQWDADYVGLMRLFAKVADGYYAYFPNKKEFTLDFEYKRVSPGVLDVKQVREVPVLISTNTLPQFLVHETNSYSVFQGEAGDVFSNHRLKSFWSFQVRNIKITPENTRESLFASVQAEYRIETNLAAISGPLTALPGAYHRADKTLVVDGWTPATGNGQHILELRTEVQPQGFPGQAPVLTLRDGRVELHAWYATPQPILAWDIDSLKQTSVTNHFVVLEPRRTVSSSSPLQHRVATSSNIVVETSFYWPTPPSRGIGEKTAPLGAWKETKITGLTTQPVVLHSEYSQTYRPGHHNFSEEFIFEPVLEPGLSAESLAELRAANVQFLHVLFNFERSQITVFGVDGKFRALPVSMSEGKTSP